MLEELDAEIQREANALTSELLPRLFQRLLQRDGLLSCERHSERLLPYVRAQINLTRAKRIHYQENAWETLSLGPMTLDHTYASLSRAQDHRDKVRAQYRSTPCTCWVRKR